MIISDILPLNDIISYFLGLISSAGALYAYALKKGILPKNIRAFVEDTQAEIVECKNRGLELKRSLDQILKNISPEEAEEITRLAQDYAAKGYTQEQALGLGLRIILAAGE